MSDLENKIGSAGGKARAEKLSSKRRSEIARDAALARHASVPPSQSSPGSLPRATHQGRIELGGLTLDCYVLEDGRRVFHKRGMAKALGLKSAGGNAFMKTISRKGIGSNISPKLREKIENPITFKPLVQDLGHGYEADVLADVAKAIVEAKEAGNLTTAQEAFAAQAQILLNAFAKVGVVALIDEATGYQELRDPGALRLLVQQYIEEEKREWEKQFPDAYYDELNRLYGSKRMTQTSRGAVIQNRPQHFAKFTRTYVYHPLENGAVLEELDRLNPIQSSGNRRARFHQHLTLGYGIEKLKRQVQEVQTLVAVSDTVNQFKRLFHKRFPEQGAQLELLDDSAEA